MTVNAAIDLPVSPGPWVDARRCDCGEDYKTFRAWPSFEDAAFRIRVANGGFGEGGGFRSRGPVLWMMRVMKLEAWYLAHQACAPEAPCHGCGTWCPWCANPAAPHNVTQGDQ